jgi:hypothetical protein
VTGLLVTVIDERCRSPFLRDFPKSIASGVEDPTMNPDQQPRSVVATFTYESENRLTAISGDRGAYPSEYSDLPQELHYEPRSPLFRFEHDAQKGIFRLEWADGEVEVFRDKPARHLFVEPDAETG